METTIVRTRRIEERAWQALTREEQAELIRLTRRFSSALRQSLNHPDN